MSAMRVTVSISDTLAERAEKWKDKFSPSELYQKALEEFVSKKEQLAERLKRDSEMREQTIERLKAQKKQAESDFFEEGQTEGVEWAKTADYSELVYAAERFDPFEKAYQIGGVHYKWVLEDDTLNDTFEALFDERPNLFKADDDGLLGSEAEKFIEGWRDGVRAFWAEMRPHLND